MRLSHASDSTTAYSAVDPMQTRGQPSSTSLQSLETNIAGLAELERLLN
jgi:hypothetical protein